MYNRVVEHRLNKGLRPMELPKIDSKVKIYVAPGQKELKRRKRRRAHTLVWKGPATVTKQISETEFETEYRGRKFEQSEKPVAWKSGDGDWGFEGFDNLHAGASPTITKHAISAD